MSHCTDQLMSHSILTCVHPAGYFPITDYAKKFMYPYSKAVARKLFSVQRISQARKRYMQSRCYCIMGEGCAISVEGKLACAVLCKEGVGSIGPPCGPW